MPRYVLVLALFAAVALASQESAENGINSVNSKKNPDCPENEEWALCGRLCEPSCYDSELVPCPPIACSESTTAACRCKQEFVRNNKEQCVKLAQCEKSSTKN